MAKKLYTIDSVAWDTSVANGKEDVTIIGVTKIAPFWGGTIQTDFSDGDIYSTFAWMENVKQGVNLTINDYSLLTGVNALAVNDTGIMTVSFPQRATGIGGQSDDDASCLQAILGGPAAGDPTQDSGCMLASISPTGNHAGASPLQLSFEVTSADGVTSAIAVSMEDFS